MANSSSADGAYATYGLRLKRRSFMHRIVYFWHAGVLTDKDYIVYGSYSLDRTAMFSVVEIGRELADLRISAFFKFLQQSTLQCCS